MKHLLLSLTFLFFSCSAESEESKQLKQQNALLKKQVEALKTVSKPKKTPNYADNVAGTYACYRVEDFLNGQTSDLPSNGSSSTFEIEEMGKNKILISEQSTSKGLLGATKSSNSIYKASVSKDGAKYRFVEIWENGGYETAGYFDEENFYELIKRRSDGKLVSKTSSRKQ